MSGLDPNKPAGKVNLTVSGSMAYGGMVERGTKLGEALKAAGREMSGHQFRSGGKTVGKDTVINDDLSVTATMRASGG